MSSRMIRITSGSAKGMRLQTPKGRGIRPTLGRVREAIFSMLATEIEGARLLDLYAGTGALGIEGLSRGAQHCTFIDSSKTAIQLIEENLQRTAFTNQATLLRQSLPEALTLLDGKVRIVFCDPPYDRQLMHKTLIVLGDSRVLEEGAIVVAQTAKKELSLSSQYGRLQAQKNKTYGETRIIFYQL